MRLIVLSTAISGNGLSQQLAQLTVCSQWSRRNYSKARAERSNLESSDVREVSGRAARPPNQRNRHGRIILAMLRRRGDLDAVNRFFADRLVQRPAVHAQDLRAALGLH